MLVIPTKKYPYQMVLNPQKNLHDITLKSPLRHHEIPIKSPLGHKSPWNPHGNLMKSPWNLRWITISRHLIFQEDPAMTEARETAGQQWVIFHGRIIDSLFFVHRDIVMLDWLMMANIG